MTDHELEDIAMTQNTPKDSDFDLDAQKDMATQLIKAYAKIAATCYLTVMEFGGSVG